MSNWLPPSISEKYFSTFERTGTTIGVVLSIVGILISLFVVKSSLEHPGWIVARDLIFVFTLVIALLSTANRYFQTKKELEVTKQQAESNALREKSINSEKLMSVKAELEESRAKLRDFGHIYRDQFELMHQCIHGFRDAVFEYIHDNDKSHEISDYALSISENDRQLIENTCDAVIDTTRTALITHYLSKGLSIKDDISVSVKLVADSQATITSLRRNFSVELSQEEEEDILEAKRIIIAIRRDTHTRTHKKERSFDNDLCSVDSNTAFNHIIQNNQERYACDNLEQLGSKYLDSNPNWNKSYNALIAVPIRYKKRNGAKRRPKCYGLMVVDSLNEQQFPLFQDDPVVFSIVAHATDILASFFLMLTLHELYDKIQDENTSNRGS